MEKYTLLYSLLAVFLIGQSSCQKKVKGDVHIYGSVRDAYSGQAVTDLDLRLYRDEKRSWSEVAPTIKWDSSRGTYDVKYITNETAKRGYTFEWTPTGMEEYYFDDNETSGTLNVNGNDCPNDIILKRMGYMTVRLIDVAPYDYFRDLEFSCDGNRYPVNLHNFSGDETFTVKLIPDHDNFWELTNQDFSYADTILLGNLNMNASGDTLYQTLQF